MSVFESKNPLVECSLCICAIWKHMWWVFQFCTQLMYSSLICKAPLLAASINSYWEIERPNSILTCPCTGLRFRIELRKWNYSAWCLVDVLLILLWHLQNSIQNSCISGFQSWVVTQEILSRSVLIVCSYFGHPSGYTYTAQSLLLLLLLLLPPIVVVSCFLPLSQISSFPPFGSGRSGFFWAVSLVL